MFVVDHLHTDQDKKGAIYYVAINTLLELPLTMANLRIHHQPDPMLLKDVNWSFAAVYCRTREFLPHEVSLFIHQVAFDFTLQFVMSLFYSPLITDPAKMAFEDHRSIQGDFLGESEKEDGG